MNDGSQITLNGISIEPKTSKTYANTHGQDNARELNPPSTPPLSCSPALKPATTTALGTVNGIYMFAVISHSCLSLPLRSGLAQLFLSLSLPALLNESVCECSCRLVTHYP